MTTPTPVEFLDHLLRFLDGNASRVPAFPPIANEFADPPETVALCCLTKHLEAFLRGELVFTAETNFLITSAALHLIGGYSHSEAAPCIQKLAYLVFNLSGQCFDLHSPEWIHFCNVLPWLASGNESFLSYSTQIYNSQTNSTKDFLISTLLKPSATTPSLRSIADATAPPGPSSDASDAFDIVGNLPPEIAAHIFSLLNGQTLLRAAGVSKKWRSRALSSRIFSNHFELPNPVYKSRLASSWKLAGGAGFPTTHAAYTPPRFYTKRASMFVPAADYFGLRWHYSMYSNPETTHVAKWLRFEGIKNNWRRNSPSAVGFVNLASVDRVTALSVNTEYAIFGGQNGAVGCVDMMTLKTVFDCSHAHTEPVVGTGIAPELDLAMSTSLAWYFVTWNLKQGYPLHHMYAVYNEGFRHFGILDHNYTISATSNKILIHRIDSRPSMHKVFTANMNNKISCLAVNKSTFLVGENTGEVTVFSKNETDRQSLKVNDSAVLQILATDTAIYTSSADCTIKSFDPVTFKLIKTFQSSTDPINHLKILPSSNILIGTSANGTITTWNTRTTERLWSRPNIVSHNNCLSVTDFGTIITGSTFGNVEVIDARTGESSSPVRTVANAKIDAVYASNTQLIAAYSTGKRTQIVLYDYDHPLP